MPSRCHEPHTLTVACRSAASRVFFHGRSLPARLLTITAPSSSSLCRCSGVVLGPVAGLLAADAAGCCGAALFAGCAGVDVLFDLLPLLLLLLLGSEPDEWLSEGLIRVTPACWTRRLLPHAPHARFPLLPALPAVSAAALPAVLPPAVPLFPLRLLLPPTLPPAGTRV